MTMPLLIRVLCLLAVIALIALACHWLFFPRDALWLHATAYLALGLGLFAVIGFSQRQLMEMISGTDDDGVKVHRSSWAGAIFDEHSAVQSLVVRSKGLVLAQRELTRAVAHELRTPVARIRFGLERVLTAVADPIQHAQRAAAMERDIVELERLIDEILVYARLDDSSPPLVLQRTCLGTLLEGVAEDAKNLGSAKNIVLDYAFDDDIWVDAEPLYFQRAIQNLVGNAVKYSRENVRIFCEIDAERAAIVVDDDGPGIALEDRRQVFETFMRLDGSRSRKTGGHGLGLAIVKRVARWHGGDVAVSSSPAGGARFSFSVRRRSGA